jgi:hypothetical protein
MPKHVFGWKKRGGWERNGGKRGEGGLEGLERGVQQEQQTLFNTEEGLILLCSERGHQKGLKDTECKPRSSLPIKV